MLAHYNGNWSLKFNKGVSISTDICIDTSRGVVGMHSMVGAHTSCNVDAAQVILKH